MFVVNDKRYSYAHIAMVEWIEGQVDARHPKTGQPVKMYAFNVHTASGHIEQLLFDVEENRYQRWHKLVTDMDAAGY